MNTEKTKLAKICNSDIREQSVQYLSAGINSFHAVSKEDQSQKRLHETHNTLREYQSENSSSFQISQSAPESKNVN
jgi:hypothetical protein